MTRVTVADLVNHDCFKALRDTIDQSPISAEVVAEVIFRDAVARGVSFEEAAAAWTEAFAGGKAQLSTADELMGSDVVQKVAGLSGLRPERVVRLVVGTADEEKISLEESAESWLKYFQDAADRRRQKRDRGPDGTPDGPASLTKEELYADRLLLDQVVTALAKKLDCNYVDALDELDRRFEIGESAADSAAVKLADALSPTLSDGEIRVALETQEQLRVQRLEQMEAAAPDAPKGEVTAGEKVKLPEGTDRAQLLTSDYELEKAYLDCEEYFVGTREDFEQVWRAEVEAGYDLVETLRYQQGSSLDARARVERRTEQYWRSRGRRPGGDNS